MTLTLLPYLYLVKTAIAMLISFSEFRTYILSMTLILAGILMLEVLNSILAKTRARQKATLDSLIKEQIIEKTDALDYYILSTKDHDLLQSKAMEGYNQGSIEKNVSLVFSLVSNVVLLAGIIFTISSLGFALLLPICMAITVRIVSEYLDRHASYIRRTEMSEINRKSRYLHQICENIRFAKEIRVFNLQGRFDLKLKETSNKKMQIWQKYMLTFRYSSATYVVADVALQLFIYLVLAYRVLVVRIITVSDFVFFFAAYRQVQSTMGDLASNNIDIFVNANYLSDFMAYWHHRPLNVTHEGIAYSGVNRPPYPARADHPVR